MGGAVWGYGGVMNGVVRGRSGGRGGCGWGSVACSRVGVVVMGVVARGR